MVKLEYKQFLLSITSVNGSTEDLGKLTIKLRGHIVSGLRRHHLFHSGIFA